MRTLAWFSCGAPSAVAAKLALGRYENVEVVRADTGSEHPDQERFTADISDWLGVPITIIKSDKYADIDEVFEDRKFLVGPKGAPCTIEMKKKPREKFQRPDDVHCWGYAMGEEQRFADFQTHEPGLTSVAPLIDAQLTEDECIAIVDRAGIAIPVLYELGYPHNNCIGCVKGGMGYWNMIRVDFPEVFARRAKQERDYDFAMCSDEIPGTDREKRPVFLDELEPGRGDIKKEARSMTCSLNCATVEAEVAVAVR